MRNRYLVRSAATWIDEGGAVILEMPYIKQSGMWHDANAALAQTCKAKPTPKSDQPTTSAACARSLPQPQNPSGYENRVAVVWAARCNKAAVGPLAAERNAPRESSAAR